MEGGCIRDPPSSFKDFMEIIREWYIYQAPERECTIQIVEPIKTAVLTQVRQP
jgi:hypothetical protein